MATVFIDNKREKKYEELNMTEEKIRQGSFLKKKDDHKAGEPTPIDTAKEAEAPEAQVQLEEVKLEEPIQFMEGSYTVPTHTITFEEPKIEEPVEEVKEEKLKAEKPKKKTGLKRVLGKLF